MSTTAATANYHLEFINGIESEKPLPKKLHALVQRYLILALSRLLPAQYIVVPELSVLTVKRGADGRREFVVPDLVVVDRYAKYEDGDLAHPPLWAVEILSPGQTIGDLINRAERLLSFGTPMVWVIWPEKHQAWEYTANSLDEKNATLSGSGFEMKVKDDPPSIEVQLHQMWEDLKENEPCRLKTMSLERYQKSA